MPDSITLSVGAYEVYLLRDGVYRVATAHLMHPGGKSARQAAIELWDRPEIVFDVNCFALSGPDGLVLVDTGSGDQDGAEAGYAAIALRDAGFRPEDVGHVLLTHIHSDHVGGLFEGDRARYPNATVHVPRGDLEFYAGDPDAAPAWKRKSIGNVARLGTVYGDRVRALDFGAVLPGIDAMALPGHTPGHTGYFVHDDRRSLLIWGDTVHVERLQMVDPQVGMDYDIDPVEALHSRQKALATAAREGWYVAGSHITGIRHVERRGDGFGFVQENGG